MQTHLKGFGLENFRVFKDYTWFDFAPITILTGPNSSGKSSLNKALMLMKESFAYRNQSNIEVSNETGHISQPFRGVQVRRPISQYHLDTRKTERNQKEKLIGLNFSSAITSQLGNFDRIVSNASSSSKIVFSLPYQLSHFPVLGQASQATVNITYAKLEGDIEIKTRIELSHNGEMLFYIENNNFYFKPKAVLSKLTLDPNRTIDIEGDDKHGSVRLSAEHNDVNMETPLSRILGEAIFLQRSNKTEVQEVVDLFFNPQSFSDEDIWTTPLFFYNDVWDADENGAYQTGEDGPFMDKTPLVTILKANGFTDSQIEFLNLDIFNFNYWLNDRWSDILTNIEFQSPIAGKVDRIYRREDKDGINQLIGEYYSKEIYKDPSKIAFLEKWAVKFNLLGEITPFLDKKHNIQGLDVGGLPLIEQGLGISQLTTLFLSILTKSSSSSTYPREKTILILEEPESNLHPKYQTLLADLFLDAAETFQIQFIIETHSEYLIRKLQVLTARKVKAMTARREQLLKQREEDLLRPKDIEESIGGNPRRRVRVEIDENPPKLKDTLIYYFHDPNNVPKGEKQVKKIEILEDGSLSDDFGPGFFDEAANWELELIRLKNSKNRNN